MISKIVFKDREKSCIPWLGDVKQLADLKKIDLIPGVNIIIGPNGSGKSTILEIMVRLFMLRSTGKTRIDRDDMREVRRGYGWDAEFLGGVYPHHDGQPVIYINPELKFGMGGGGSFFIDTKMGIENMMAARDLSTGQYGFYQIMNGIKSNPGEKIDSGCIRDNNKCDKEMRKFYEGQMKKVGPKTIIMDEPERSLDILAQIELYQFVKKVSDEGRAQFIIASHSPLAMNLEDANFIETKDGYRESCLKAWKEWTNANS